jgi:hypothetical protein
MCIQNSGVDAFQRAIRQLRGHCRREAGKVSYRVEHKREDRRLFSAALTWVRVEGEGEGEGEGGG